MSFFSGITLGLFRETRDGRRVVGFGPAGFRKRWYLVDDGAAPVVERRFRQSYAATYLVVFPAAIVLSGRNWWFIAALVILSPLAMWNWVVRDLPRTQVAEEELIPFDRKARELAQSQAMGEPTLWFLTVAGGLMAALAIGVAIAEGDWWAWVAVLMFGALTAMMARQILAVRRARSVEGRER